MNPRQLKSSLFATTLFALPLASCGVPVDGGVIQEGAPQLPQTQEDRAATLISLHSQLIDTTQAGALPTHLQAQPAAANEEEILLVKYPKPITTEQEQALRASTKAVYTYLPYFTYLVKMPPLSVRTAATFPGASWTGLYHPAYKLSPEIAKAHAAMAGGGKDARPVMIHAFPDVDPSVLGRSVQQILGQGATMLGPSSSSGSFVRLRLLLTPAEIANVRDRLAKLREVFWIELEGRRVLRNDTTVWVGQSGLAAGMSTPLFSQGIYGQGQTVAVLDTGIDADSCFFREPGAGLPPINACDGGTLADPSRRKVVAVNFLAAGECSSGISGTEWDTQGHGSHVAGTVAGDNLANPLLHDAADGMAPGAKLVIQDAGFATDNCGDLPGIGCPVVDLKPIFLQAHNQGARLHSNSWGDNENAAVQNNYTAASQDVDQFMWDHKDHLILFAAGNSGPGAGSVGSPSTNKNGVSVGATLRGTSAESMASFSSCGKTADGRIKPDITVPGSSIVSAGNDRNIATNNCSTTSMSGTSMATPGAAGLLALIRQYYVDGFYPGGSKVAANGFVPTSALLKATLVNSAINMSGTTAIPANCQGWGRVLLENSLYFAGQSRKLWVKDNAPAFGTGSTNEEYTHTVQIGGSEPLKVTLTWTDYPSTPAANPNLNNDLDLIVSGPSGTYLGNVFAGGVSVSAGAADRRNPLEQVLLASPAPGTYTVTVRSFQIPTGPQPFALVVSGGLGSSESQATFTSVASQDGWVLESGETSEVGGSAGSTSSSASALRVGDDNGDRQYKAVVSFDTSALPDGAVVLSATLRLRRGTVFGTNPFNTHGVCYADASSAFSGSTTVQASDFEAAASVVRAATMGVPAINGSWSEGALSAAGRAAINKTGTTQLRVYCTNGDNDDLGTDYVGFYSGENATESNRPQLVLTYQ